MWLIISSIHWTIHFFLHTHHRHIDPMLGKIPPDISDIAIAGDLNGHVDENADCNHSTEGK